MVSTTLTALLLIVSLQINFVQCRIRVNSPSALAKSLQSEYDENGSLKHQLSQFGNINYQEKSLYTVLLPFNDIYGCDPNSFKFDKRMYKTRIAFLIKRGGCLYKKKVTNVHKFGGDMAIVYSDDLKVWGEYLLPILGYLS